MLRVLELPVLAELEHALAHRLEPAPTPAERRWSELGVLARLLNERQPLPGEDAPRLERRVYEQHRARHAPQAPDPHTLVERYGSWRKACRAAYGLLPDGRYGGVGNPWPSPFLGRTSAAPYTREEVSESIRQCALDLGRIPTSHDYHYWTREKKRRGRLSGANVRHPSISVLYRLYRRGENRWQLALTDARLNVVEIAQSRAQKLLGRASASLRPADPIARLQRLDAYGLAAAGISREKHVQIIREGFTWLPLNLALALARALGGSLDWLAGLTLDSGMPPEEAAALQPKVLAELIAKKKVEPKLLRDHLDLPNGPYRDLISGKREPILAELIVISCEVSSPISRFVSGTAPAAD